VFTKKPDPTGHRKKVRGVACGNFVKPGVGEETYASSAEVTGIRLGLRIAALQDWAVMTIDVSCAFLNAPLASAEAKKGESVICVRPPNIFVAAGEVPAGSLWWVKKALYGLRESPKAWCVERDKQFNLWEVVVQRESEEEYHQPTENRNVSRKEEILVLREVPADPGVWLIVPKDSQSNMHVRGFVFTYVDDFLVTASAKVARAVTECVGKQWKCSPAQVLSQKEFIEFTGMRISRINEGIMVSQEHYSQTLLKRVGMSEAVGSNIVMDSEECNDPEVTLQIEAGSWVPELATVRAAQKAVGELNWLSTRTRPDIAYAVQRAASFALRDPDRALRITRRIHKYLITTTGYGLIYRTAAALKHAAEEDGSSPLRQHYDTSALIGYSDASFAPQGSSSQQAFVVMLGGAAILWKTGRQKIVAQSTAEAELLAELDCYLALSGIAAMLQDMTPSPIHTLLAVDNQAAVQLTGGTTTSVSWRTRHLRVKAAGLVQAVMNQELKVVHVPGEFQVADLGTKNLSSAVLKRLIKLLALGTMTTGATAANATSGEEEFEDEPFWFWIGLCILVLWAFILWFGRRWIVWTPLFDSPEPEPEQEAAHEEQEVWQEIPEVAEEEPQQMV